MPRTGRLIDCVRHHAEVRPTKEAMRDLATGRTLTYARLDERADRLARFLQDAGVGAGDRVALLAVNGTEFFELQFACARIGAIGVLLNWRLTVHELAYIVGDSTPLVLIHDASFAGVAGELRDRCAVGRLVRIDGTDPDSDYERALRSAPRPPAPAEVSPDDTCTILYTSGTTGHPKGALITHDMIFWNCVNLGFPAGVDSHSVQLVILPLFHTGALNCCANPVLYAGGKVVIKRDPSDALAAFGDPELGITHVVGVPTVYQMLAEHPDFASTDLSRLRFAAIGGAVCPKPITDRWAARGIDLLQIYGLTETIVVVAMVNPADALPKLGSVGRAVMHADVRVVGPDGRDVAPGEVGEIWARGPSVTPGYWNRPDADADAFHEGWFRSGDAAFQDADGFFHIVDRWKDMYKSGGENVYPAEVETVLHLLPEVAEVAVVGVPHERWGETGLAVVVIRPGVDLDEQRVLAHCRERLARYKVPGAVRFVDALPRNALGKILKRELRDTGAGTAVPDAVG